MNPNAPAFANSSLGAEGNGLTIRDYIAIEAMKALLIDSEHTDRLFSSVGPKEAKQAICELAFSFADALIAESNKKQ